MFYFAPMQTETELSNRALTLIGEARIINIEDVDDRAARLCRAHMQEAIEEAIRPHKWTCAVDRATLSRSYPDPLFGWPFAFQKPIGFIRLLEVNGEEEGGSNTSYQLEGNRILSRVDSVQVRYLKSIEIRDMDPLLRAAVAAKLAKFVVVPLTGSTTLLSAAINDYGRCVGEAMTTNAIEQTANANNPMYASFAQSLLLTARRGRIYMPSYRKP